MPRHAAGERVAEEWGGAEIAQDGDAAGHVPEGPPIRAIEAVREERPDVPVDDGVGGGEPLEVGLAQDQHLEVRHGADGGRRGLPGQDGHLADRAPRHGGADASLDAVAVGDEDVRRAALDDVRLERAVALGEDDRPLREVPVLETLQLGFERPGRKPREDRRLLHVAGRPSRLHRRR